VSDDFEQPLRAIEQRIAEVESAPDADQRGGEIARLRTQLSGMRRQIFAGLTPWQKTLVARHARRPYTLDYVEKLCTDFSEFHGDRRFADDPAIVSGFALLRGRPVAIVGHQKGRTTREKLHRNFGMPRPEGYRKALRVMQLADKFRRPVLTFIDTPGAYPGIDAEERGQAEAIAFNLREMARLGVPVICTVTGEGGSGGALAIGVGNRINILQFAVYSVISPEGCASILFRDAARAPEVAASMKMTAEDLKGFGIVDQIIPEPEGGAHTDPEAAVQSVGSVLERQLDELAALSPEALVADRYRRFRDLGRFTEINV
jgi:acetyl-CoA carboxylase carboxyl transferase subunit alpha